MNLEQRVQALENEMAVLKNQIQTALLDIQSMLMTNAYPALRGESAPPSSSGWADDTAPAAPSGSALPVRKFSLEQLGETSDESEALPAVRQAVPGQFNGAPIMPPPAPQMQQRPSVEQQPRVNQNQYAPQMPPPAPEPPRVNQTQYAPEVPSRQMPQPQQPYGNGMDYQNGNGTPAWALPQQPQPPEPQPYAQFLAPEPSHAPVRRQMPGANAQEEKRMEELRLWVLDKINDIGGQATIDELLTYSHSDYFSPEELNDLINFAMETAEQQLAQVRPPVPPAARRARKAVVQSAEAVIKQRKATRAILHPGEDPEEHRKTLLKLIAGIQSAGTNNNPKGRKK